MPYADNLRKPATWQSIRFNLGMALVKEDKQHEVIGGLILVITSINIFMSSTHLYEVATISCKRFFLPLINHVWF